MVDNKCALLSASAYGSRARTAGLWPTCGDLQFLIPCCVVLSSRTHWKSWGDDNGACSLCLSNAAPWNSSSENFLFRKDPVNAFLHLGCRSCLSLNKPGKVGTSYKLPRTWSPDRTMYSDTSVPLLVSSPQGEAACGGLEMHSIPPQKPIPNYCSFKVPSL